MIRTERSLKSTVKVLDRPTQRKPELEKDNEELQLEKLVFGDDEGFNQALRTYHTEGSSNGLSGNEGDDTASEVGEELDDVADDDLFFIDTGIPKSEVGAVVLSTQQEDPDDTDAPAWIDSEDEKIVVSLASNTRLRKLRKTEAEDLVHGKEYIKRLQQQFERLHPRPAWALQAENGNRRKKKRRSSFQEGSGDEIDSDDSIDLEEIDVQPLSKLLRSTDLLTESPSSDSSKRILRAGILDIQRSKDIGGTQPSAISSLSFHPTKPLLLSTGPSGLLTLFHLSPESQPPNPPIHTLSVPRHPIYTSAIDPTGDSIYFSSRRRYFLNWSLTTGKITRSTRLIAPVQKTSSSKSKTTDQRSCERFKLSPCGRWIALIGTSKKVGIVNILTTTTAQWICQARVEGKNGIADLSWWRNGEGLVILSKSGEAIEYSVSQKQAIARWHDQDLVSPTVVCLGGSIRRENGLGSDKWLAIGSQSGIVSIYDRSEWLVATSSSSSSAHSIPANPTACKTLQQLTTPISHMTFSSDAQLFLMSSRWKKDALRLVHVGSWTVYPRWPTNGTPLGRITAVALSPDHGSAGGGKRGRMMLVVGNEAGKIRSWEIK